jgi:peptidoglycan/LPS O-acetylase OafA/YrhL
MGMRAPGEIEALTGLRAIAALWVFLFHASNFADRIGSDVAPILRFVGAGGFLGVDVFFVLSGFVLAYTYGAERWQTPRVYARYLWKRVARIYPVHVLTMLLLAVVAFAYGSLGMRLLPPSRMTLDALVSNLLMTQAWTMPIVRSWNTVAWSISCEWAAYLCLPLIAIIARQIQTSRLLFTLIAASFIILGLVIGRGDHPGTMAYGLLRIAVEFPAGVLLYRAWQLSEFQTSRAAAVVGAMALGSMVLGGNATAAIFGDRAAMSFMPALACAVVYGCAAGTGAFVELLGLRATTYGGRISYAFYMVHGIVLAALTVAARQITGIETLPLTLAAIGAAFAVTLVLAAAVYRYWEVPCRQVFAGATRASRSPLDGPPLSRDARRSNSVSI